MHERTDEIARAAARLLHDGRVSGLRRAIEIAMEKADDDVHAPTAGRVRQHLQALSMATMGAADYDASVRAFLEVAEELMTALDRCAEPMTPYLAGRAARGLTDGDHILHMRVYTDVSLERLIDELEMYEYPPPQIRTFDSIHGRLNRLVIEDEESGATVYLTRVPRQFESDAGKNLFNGESIKVADLDDVRALIKAR